MSADDIHIQPSIGRYLEEPTSENARELIARADKVVGCNAARSMPAVSSPASRTSGGAERDKVSGLDQQCLVLTRCHEGLD